MYHSMKRLVAIIMVYLACAVIMLHAVVPHHHHDCCGTVGLVFENEACCHCDEACHDTACEHHDGHHSHHPFDICLLQEMLSHLTLTTNDDEYCLAALIKAEANDFFVLFSPVLQPEEGLPPAPEPDYWPSEAVALYAGYTLDAASLRAPPVLA